MNTLLGKITYIVTYPGIRLMLWRSRRAYVVVQSQGEVLVTQNWLGLHNKWRLPGGGLKKHETPTNGAVRELYEETGIVAQPSELVPLGAPGGYVAYSKCHYWLFLLDLPQKPTITADNKELVKAEFRPLTVIKNEPIAEEITEALGALYS